MSTKPFKFRYANELAGGFVLLALLILGIAVAVSGRVQDLFTRYTTITLKMPAEGSLGLKEGADVVVLGTPVGTVQKITFENGEMTAKLSVRTQYMQVIRQDSLAIIRKAQLIGDAYVEIPRGKGEPFPEGNITLQVSPDRSATEAAENLLNELRAKALPLIDKLSAAAEAYTRLAVDLQSPEGDLKQAMASLNRVIATAEKGDGIINKLLHDPKLAEEISQTGPKVNAALDESNKVLKNLNEASGELPAMTATLNKQLEQLPPLVKQMEASLAEAEAVMLDLQKSTSQLPQTVTSINKTVEGLPSLVVQTQETLRQIQRLVEGVQRSWLVRGSIQEDPAAGASGRISPDRVGGGK